MTKISPILSETIIQKYAELLTRYCVRIKPGDRVVIRSTYLAEPLILACQKQVLLAGGTCEFDIGLPGVNRQKYDYATYQALQLPSILYGHIVNEFDAIISINAPFNVLELQGIDETKLALAQAVLKPIKTRYMQRGKSGDLRWVICNYPTQSLADMANMTLSDYAQFITNGCFLHLPNPIHEWETLSARQEKWAQLLTNGKHIRFVANHVDISFSIDGRRWINSDGKRNMPSGEVFTSPVEPSANGHILFNYPSLLFGHVIPSLRLVFKDGQVVEWDTDGDAGIIERLLSIDGARVLGEIAVGTNPYITKPTLNTLFDEKIGGTIHMALGASYPETGGKNESGIHHDFITSFQDSSQIILDGSVIYENGSFL